MKCGAAERYVEACQGLALRYAEYRMLAEAKITAGEIAPAWAAVNAALAEFREAWAEYIPHVREQERRTA